MCGELVLLSCHNQRYTRHTIHQVTDPLVLSPTLLSPLGNDLDIIQESRLPTSQGEVQGYSNFTDLCTILLSRAFSAMAVRVRHPKSVHCVNTMHFVLIARIMAEKEQSAMEGFFLSGFSDQ